MRKIIPYNHQSIDRADIKAVTKVLRSDWMTQGPAVKEFEAALCRYTGCKYAVVVANGTAALHLALLALKVGKGDQVVAPAISFAASANCALYVGAKPQLMDIDPQTWHLDIEQLRDYLKRPAQRKNVKVVVPVDLMGTVVDIKAVAQICDKYGIRILRDACHAIGSRYRNTSGQWEPVGRCRYGETTVFSFHPIKNIATGEGGAIVTNDREIYESALRLRHHGITRAAVSSSGPLARYRDEPWFYDIDQLGYNFRLTDLQCALGISQLKKLNSFVERRRERVERYQKAFAEIPQLKLPYTRPDTRPAYHLYVVRVKNQQRDGLCRFLRENGIYTQVNYIPIHWFTYYQKHLGYRQGDFPGAEEYFQECLSLPLYPDLTAQDQKRVIGGVLEYLKYGAR